MRSGNDAGLEVLAHNLCSSATQKVFSEAEVRALCRPLRFLHIELVKPCLYRASLWIGAQSGWN